MTDDSKQDAQRKSWVEEIEVAGEKLVAFVRELANDARVRRIRVKARDGDVTVDIPLTVGAIAGGAVVIAAPVLAVLGALAAFVAKLDVEIVREAEVKKDAAPKAPGQPREDA
ncbi:MAG: DUF4342 domain-containing protein [Rhodobacteraceae bacterium]|jgi:hypothetical protein|nr:DUF4342 domain-containing protein [Paracoccaceae bacterium]